MASFIKTVLHKSLLVPSTKNLLGIPGVVKFSSASNKPLFNPHDALQTDSLLMEEEIKIRDVARDYARNELMPRILKANRNEQFDREIFREMGKLGILGCTVG